MLEINIGIVCGAAISLPALFGNRRNGIRDLESRLSTRWTRIDSTITTSNNSTIFPYHHKISRCSNRLEDDLSVADRNCALEDASHDEEKSTIFCTEKILNCLRETVNL